MSPTETAVASATGGPVHSRCPLCNGTARRAFDALDRNRAISAESFGYARCRSCGTTFISEPPPDMGRYYEGGYYQFAADGEPNWKTEPRRIQAAAFRVALLLRHVAPGVLIEIGAGTGAFACAVKNAGFDVTAIEMSERCCRYLSEREGIAAICTDLPLEALAALPRARAIALWHVLEHLANPAEVLEQAAAKLEPGGVLALAIPNPRSLQFRLLGARWAHLDAPRHLCLMPAEALIREAHKLGLSAVEITCSDPDGLECNFFGWINALRSHPAEGPTPWLAGHAALVVNRLLAPVERTGNRGAATTIVMRKDQ